MSSKPHTLRAFDNILGQYRKKVLRMFACSHLSLELAAKALSERNSDLANQVIADDDEIDALNKEINQEGIEILTCFTPVSVDLRFVLSVMRLSSLVERFGDYSVNICRHTLNLNKLNELQEARLLEPVFHSLLEEAKTIRLFYEKEDFESIGNHLFSLQEMEEKASLLTEKLARLSEEEQISIPSLAQLIFISRSLEHITACLSNISEEMLQQSR